MAVMISDIEKGSCAERAGIKAGEQLVSVNGKEIYDVLDYRFYIGEARLRLALESDGEAREITLRKPEEEDPGLMFDTYLMDKQKSCRNKCVFCFIDQLPQGLRESLYFKDDDSRLSFLFGNYITLTNITEHEVERIIEMHISPINISVHTTNPNLRIKMMNNKNAGKALEILKRLAASNIKINCQLVLCPGINDGAELKHSLADLISLYPSIESIAVVPVGLTKYRDGLCSLSNYDRAGAGEVIDIIEQIGDLCMKECGTRIAYASDEFYIEAGRDFRDAEFYGEFAQLENGVGMCALLKSEFLQAVQEYPADTVARSVSIATGRAVYPLICDIVDIARNKWHNLKCNVYAIENEFFGTTIDVTGLLTGQDLIHQLSGQELGNKLLLSASMFRKEGDMMLDNVTPELLHQKLGTEIKITPNDGYELLNNMLEK